VSAAAARATLEGLLAAALERVDPARSGAVRRRDG
jgi:hypothetical protein